MDYIEFKEQNVIIAEDQPEYQNLPALKLRDAEGTMITCIGVSFRERIAILFTGRLWMSELTFGKSITPRYMSVKKSDIVPEQN